MTTPSIGPDGLRLSSRRPAVFALLAIAVTGLLTAIIAGVSGGTTPSTFAFEVAKTGLQLIAVAGVGSVATIAVQTYLTAVRSAEEERRRAVEKAEVQLRQADERADKDRRIREEQRQREVDRLTDARLRRDQLLRSTIQSSIRTYNNVKGIRRRLRAATGFGPDAVVPVEVYDRFLGALIDEQLQLEELKRLSPSLDRPDLQTDLDGMEKYLGRVIEEYEMQRSQARPDGLAMSDLPQLRDLLTQDTFWDAMSVPLNRMVTALQQELLSPLALPDPTPA